MSLRLPYKVLAEPRVPGEREMVTPEEKRVIKTGHINRNFDNAKIVLAWYNMDLQEGKQMKKVVVILLVAFGDSFEHRMKDAMLIK